MIKKVCTNFNSSLYIRWIWPLLGFLFRNTKCMHDIIYCRRSKVWSAPICNLVISLQSTNFPCYLTFSNRLVSPNAQFNSRLAGRSEKRYESSQYVKKHHILSHQRWNFLANTSNVSFFQWIFAKIPQLCLLWKFSLTGREVARYFEKLKK